MFRVIQGRSNGVLVIGNRSNEYALIQLAAALGLAWAQPVLAAPATAATAPTPCASAHQLAQEARQSGRLRQARELFLNCSKSSCGELIAQQCRSALQVLDTDIPSVIPVVTDRNGGHVVEVQVAMDGELLTSRIDGRGLPVDPGLREFSFSTRHGVFHTEKVLIVEGQRNRLLSVQLKGAPQPASAKPAAAPVTHRVEAAEAPAKSVRRSGASAVPVIVIGGAGLAAVASGFLLAHWASNDGARLDRCAPNCRQDSVDHVSDLYLAADITLGIGVVGLGAATWLYFTRQGSEDPVTPSSPRVDVTPTAGGAKATVRGVF